MCFVEWRYDTLGLGAGRVDVCAAAVAGADGPHARRLAHPEHRPAVHLRARSRHHLVVLELLVSVQQHLGVRRQ